MRGMLWEPWGTFGRSLAVMWCFGMRHFAPWWMTVVSLGLASFGASSRVSGWDWARHRGDGFVFQAVRCVGWCRWDGKGALLYEVPVGCLHVFAYRQSVPRCSCRLCEVLVEEAVLRPFGKL